VRSVGPGEICTVELDGGGVVSALAVIVGGAGARTTLSIRPERVVVEPRGGECDTVLSARVEELIYHGDHTRVRLQVGGRSDFSVKLSPREGARPLAVGSSIEIGWQSGYCRALDASQE
jgi:putative spermidine/putrescine transport system ATP-binding protein